MSYVYLLDLHRHLDEWLAAVVQDREAAGDPQTAAFHDGRRDELRAFKAFLTAEYNPRLPRAFRRRTTQPPAGGPRRTTGDKAPPRR